MPIPTTTTPTEGVIASESFDDYELMLERWEARGGAFYVAVVHMKLHFLFQEGSAGQWHSPDRVRFVQEFERLVRQYWGLHQIGRSAAGARIALSPRFTSRIDGVWVTDHWEIVVLKSEDGYVGGEGVAGETHDGRRFALGPAHRRNRVYLSSAGNRRWRFVPSAVTIPSVHEYGHMLDPSLEDEYYYMRNGKSWDPERDRQAVLNYGTTVRARNVRRVLEWAQRKAAEHEREAAARRRSAATLR